MSLISDLKQKAATAVDWLKNLAVKEAEKKKKQQEELKKKAEEAKKTGQSKGSAWDLIPVVSGLKAVQELPGVKQLLEKKTYTKPGTFEFKLKESKPGETVLRPGPTKLAASLPSEEVKKAKISLIEPEKISPATEARITIATAISREESEQKAAKEQKGLLPYLMPETLEETKSKLASATTLKEKLGITALAGLSLTPLTPELKGVSAFSKVAPEIAKISKAEDIFKILKPLLGGKTDDEIRLASEALKIVDKEKDVVKYLKDFSSQNYLDETGKIVKQEFRTDKLALDTTQTAKTEADRARLGLTSREVRGTEEVKALAQEIGSDPQKLLRDVTNNRITDSEVVALKNAITTNSDFLIQQDKLLQSPGLTEKAKKIIQYKMDNAQQVIDKSLQKLIKGGTEAGRTVNAYKILANRTLDPVFWQMKALKLSGKKNLDAPVIKAIDHLINQKDTLGLARLMMEIQKATPTEKIITLWKAGLLTSPTTHLANIGGNLGMSVLENIIQVPASAIDSLISLGTKRRTKIGLSPQRLLEQAKGAKRGLSEAKDYFKYGAGESERLKWDIPKQINFNNKVLQGYTQTIFRSLGAEDKVFKQAKISDSIFEQAKVALKNKDDVYNYAIDALKSSGKEVNDKNIVKFLTENPTDEMALIAINDAEYITFQSENALASIISFAKKGAKTKSEFAAGAIDFVAPFSKTPSNVAARIVDYSPAGLVRTIFSQLKKEKRFTQSYEAQKSFSEMMARGITGTGVMALGSWLAYKGLITGSYPTDSTERMLWEQEGKQPNSILIAGKWRNMDKISPVGNILTLGAKLWEFKNKGSSGITLAGQTALAGVKGLTEQTFLSGVSGALGAVTNPEQGGAKYVRQAMASTVPTILGKISRITDPVKREQVRWWEGAQAKIPGLSKFLPEKLDSFGQQQLYENGAFGWRALFDPFGSKEAKDTVLTSELRRLWKSDYKVNPTSLNTDTSVNGVKIKYSQDELNVLKSSIGTAWLKVLTEVVQNPKYEKMSDYEKQKTLRGLIGDIKEEFVKVNPPYGTGILRKAGVKITEGKETAILNTIMMEVVETKDWKNLSDEDREELVKSFYAKILQKGISEKTVNNPL